MARSGEPVFGGDLVEATKEEPPFRRSRHQVDADAVGGRCFASSVEAGEEFGAHRGVPMAGLQLAGGGGRLQHGGPGGCAISHGHGDGAVELDDRSRCDPAQLAVERGDLAPVGVPGSRASSWTAAMAAWSWYGPGPVTDERSSAASRCMLLHALFNPPV